MVGLLTALGANPGFLSTLGWLIERATPGDTRALVEATLASMRQALSRGTAPVLGLGLVGVLWVASNGFDVIMKSRREMCAQPPGWWNESGEIIERS